MGIGQSFKIVRAMIVILDDSGEAQAWEVRDGQGEWEFTGVAEDDGLSTAKITLSGKFKRRSKVIAGASMGELLE